jgi:hypothetical protein
MTINAGYLLFFILLTAFVFAPFIFKKKKEDLKTTQWREDAKQVEDAFAEFQKKFGMADIRDNAVACYEGVHSNIGQRAKFAKVRSSTPDNCDLPHFMVSLFVGTAEKTFFMETRNSEEAIKDYLKSQGFVVMSLPGESDAMSSAMA